MKNKEQTDLKKEKKNSISGTAKEKASFDQNGKGNSDKYGQAGTSPNESGNDKGIGIVKPATK